MKTIGVDVGGTFTDLVYCDMDTGQLAIHKISTTPDDPSRGVMQGIAELCRDNGVAAGDIDYVLHGTTTATNAVLEHKGARRRHAHQRRLPRHHSHRPPSARRALLDHAGAPLAEPAAGQAASPQGRQRRLVPPRGEELEPLDEAGVRAAARALEGRAASRRSQSASCSPTSTRRTRNAPRPSSNEELPGVLHHHVVVDLAAVPRVRALHHGLRCAPSSDQRCAATSAVSKVRCATPGFIADLRIMASNGGVATPAMVSRETGDDVAVGLAAGVLGGAWVGGLSGPAQARHLRHRRHQRRYRYRRRRPLRRDRRARAPRSPASRCCCR